MKYEYKIAKSTPEIVNVDRKSADDPFDVSRRK